MTDTAIEITMDEKPGQLTEDQREMIQAIYGTAKDLTESIVADASLDNSIKITHLMAQLMTIAERININNQKISGPNKKAIVLELGRLLIKDLAKDDSQRVKMLLMYDVLAEKTLEVMIDMSRTVNTHAAKVASSCWDCLAGLCGKKPLTDEEKIRQCV